MNREQRHIEEETELLGLDRKPGTIDKQKEEYGEALLRTFESMEKAFSRAGGVCPNIDRLKSMSVFQFLCMIAPNGIQFKHINNGD